MRVPVSALAVLTLAASAEAKVVSRSIEYRHGDAVLEGYLAYDDAQEGKRPGVLIVHEWWGLGDYVKRRADQLAEAGYVAFALDMYGKGVTTSDPMEASRLAGQFYGKPLMRERAKAGLDILVRQEQVDAKRIAAIGYCFGGTTVLQLAFSGAELAGVVSFHGGLAPPAPEDDAIKARILVLHGADDPFVPTPQVATFQEELRKRKADWQMVYYGGAVHSFSNPAAKGTIPGAKYDANADRRSWRHMITFFDEVLGEPSPSAQ